MTTKSGSNRIDFDFRELLTVALFYPVALAPFLFENNYFVALYERVKDSSAYRGALHYRRADVDGAAAVNQVNLVERNAGALFGF